MIQGHLVDANHRLFVSYHRELLRLVADKSVHHRHASDWIFPLEAVVEELLLERLKLNAFVELFKHRRCEPGGIQN